jgi:hypothetical protein
VIKGTITRENSTPHGTPGRLVLENGFECDTLELPWHNNERGKSCIRPDTYRGWAWYSPTFKRIVIRLEDKHGRKDCLIHPANFAAEERDVDGDGDLEVTQIHGCTAPGRGFGEIRDKTGDLQWGILNSKHTMDRLMESLEDGQGGYHEVEITYKWAEGSEPV